LFFSGKIEDYGIAADKRAGLWSDPVTEEAFFFSKRIFVDDITS